MLQHPDHAPLGFLKPQMPTLVSEPPAGDGWLHEIKHDGYRTLIVIDRGTVRAFTRNGHDWSARYGPIVEACAQLKCRSAIMDGELIVQDEKGVSDFQALRAAIARSPQQLVLFAFDLLHLDGEDLRPLPLIERRRQLRRLMPRSTRSCLQFSHHAEGEGAAVFAAAAELGLEGIVSKKATSRYRSGPSLTWLKTKCMEEGEFVVLGAEQDARGIPHLILAREAERGLAFAGTAFLTLHGTERDALREAMGKLKADKSAIRSLRRKGAEWVKPELRARVRYLRGGGALRHASVKELLSH